MKSIDIKGKSYIEVNERIKYFRENYKDWALESELISLDNGICVIKATVRNPEGIIKATGYAYEKENSTFINKTSYIENCETSAWGRALGNFGIGIDTSIASAEEVLNAQLNQKKEKPNADFVPDVIKNQEEPKVSTASDLEIMKGVSSLLSEDACTDYWNENVGKLSGATARKSFAELIKKHKETLKKVEVSNE